ncbi:MAG: hypothetical protein JXB13_00670 [Phycisphaerae bacterium]|nr:hypothetical protein [Phycisphaerae bacterium]
MSDESQGRSGGQKLQTRVPISHVSYRYPHHAAWSGHDRLSDFIMELQASLHMLRHRRSIYHVLYGEKSYRYLGCMAGWNGNALIATFHQPPEVFPEHVANPAPLGRLPVRLAAHLRAARHHQSGPRQTR